MNITIIFCCIISCYFSIIQGASLEDRHTDGIDTLSTNLTEQVKFIDGKDLLTTKLLDDIQKLSMNQADTENKTEDYMGILKQELLRLGKQIRNSQKRICAIEAYLLQEEQPGTTSSHPRILSKQSPFIEVRLSNIQEQFCKITRRLSMIETIFKGQDNDSESNKNKLLRKIRKLGADCHLLKQMIPDMAQDYEQLLQQTYLLEKITQQQGAKIQTLAQFKTIVNVAIMIITIWIIINIQPYHSCDDFYS